MGHCGVPSRGLCLRAACHKPVMCKSSAGMADRMRIAILGAGAMGSLFGGYLSRHNDVWLVETDQKKVDKINLDGIRIREEWGDETFHPKAVHDAGESGQMDLVIRTFPHW